MSDDAETGPVLISETATVLGGVADANLDAGVTRRMLKAIYRLTIPLVILPLLVVPFAYIHFVGFDWGVPLVCLGAVAAGVVLLVALRLVLGFGWLLLRFLDQLALLPAAVLSLNSQVAELRSQVAELGDGVVDLRGDVAPLSGVVQGLTGHVDALQGSLEEVQFWRNPSRLWKGGDGRPKP